MKSSLAKIFELAELPPSEYALPTDEPKPRRVRDARRDLAMHLALHFDPNTGTIRVAAQRVCYELGWDKLRLVKILDDLRALGLIERVEFEDGEFDDLSGAGGAYGK